MNESENRNWRRYLRFWGANVREDVDTEIAFHLEGLIAYYVENGMSPEQARRAALDRFGDTDRIASSMQSLVRERETAMRRTEWLDSLTRDLSFAFRQLRKRPGFTAVALLTLALGIGANTAIFSAVNTVLLKPLPVRDLDRIIMVQSNIPKLNLIGYPVDPTEAFEIASRRDAFAAAGGYHSTNPILTGGGEARRLAGTRTLGRFFEVFGAVPYLGRFYRPDESENDQHRVVVLAYDFWREMGADRSIVGTKIELNGVSFEVIGVGQPDFRYPRGVQVWLPFPFIGDARTNHGRMYMNTVIRLKAGTTPAAIGGVLKTVTDKFHPGANNEYYLTTRPIVSVLAGQLRPALLVLLGAVGFVLLIACANVASLQLVHGTARMKEMAVRAALGAERGTIVRQLLVENLVLSLGGGLLGLGIGVVILKALAAAGAAQLPALAGVTLDGTVLGFTAVATIVSGLLFGILPAARAGRVDLQATLKDGTRSMSLTSQRSRVLQSAVVIQVALTLVLLLGAGLMVRSLRGLLTTQPGFVAERVTTMRVAIAGSNVRADELTSFFTALLGKLAATPGLEAVGMVSELPFSENTNSSPFGIGGRSEDPNGPRLHANLHNVGGDYFKAMGIPILRGRSFEPTDTKSSQPVVIIDDQLAKQFFPTEDPIGKVITRQGPDATIIGVVGTVSQSELGEPAKATTYYSYTQHAWYPSMYLTVRTTLPLASVVPTVRNVVTSVEPKAPIYEPLMLEERINISLAPRRLAMAVLTGLAVLSLGLAVFGLYAVISYAVSQRTTEFGIRVALGAQSTDVRRMVIGQGVMLALIGVAVGMVAALGATQALSKLLYGVSPRDPLTFVGAAVVLSAVAVVASYLPARRATRVSPLEALRS
jgi:predicted permease